MYHIPYLRSNMIFPKNMYR